MISILQQFHTYLPKTDEMEFDSQIFTGDQLTVERAVNMITSVSNGFTPEDRLEGITIQIADWHAGVKILEVSCYKWITTTCLMLIDFVYNCSKKREKIN